MRKKLKSENGSVMSLAIVLIVLVGMVGTSITMMVTNQIKTNHKNSNNTDLKYTTEAGVEEVIGKFIEEINIKENIKFSGFGILEKYISLSDSLVASNGIFDSTVDGIYKSIIADTVDKSQMTTIIEKINNSQTVAGGSNLSAKEIALIARDYAVFFEKHLFNNNSQSIQTLSNKEIKELMSIIINNLSIRAYVVNNCNLGIAYRDIVTLSNKGQSFKSVYNEFKSGSSIIDDIQSIISSETLQKSRIDKLITDIKNTNYNIKIQKEIDEIENGNVYNGSGKLMTNTHNYLNVGNISEYYDKTGNVAFSTVVSKRLELIKVEIDMLIECLELLNGKTTSSGGSESSTLTISVPKQVTVEDKMNEVKKTISIEPVILESDTPDVELATGSTDPTRYEFNILEKRVGTQVVLDLKIKSKIEDYIIKSDVKVIIHSIVNTADYKVVYEIINWDKKID